MNCSKVAIGIGSEGNRVTWRRSGCRGLQFGIAISLVFLTACQAQSQNGDERAVAAQRGPVAERQMVFDRLTGEYRGTHEGDSLVVWVESVAAVEAGQQAVLLIFREQDRSRLETWLRKIIDNPADYYREVCEGVERIDHGYHFPDFYRAWDTQGGLVLLQDGFQGGRVPHDGKERLLFDPRLFQGGRLPPGWEEIEGRAYPVHLRNEEYLVLRQREYAIRKIRRSIETGALESVHLTQTGYIQNFFDNPVIGLTRVDNSLPPFRLLGSYLDSKFHALEELGLSRTPWSPDLPEVCKTDPR